MESIEVYAFENAEGEEAGFTTQDAAEAKKYAQANGLRWIAYVFTFEESELVEDYTKE